MNKNSEETKMFAAMLDRAEVKASAEVVINDIIQEIGYALKPETDINEIKRKLRGVLND